MTTRAELRTSLRQRLEDTGAAPLWADAMLNDALAGAIRAYGTHLPKEETTSLVVTAGATRVPLATPAIDPARIVRVLDETDAVVPRAADGEEIAAAAGVPAAQAWRWWEATLILSRPATAGTWQIEHLAPRALPSDDVTPLDVLPGDEEVLLALAMATALRRRATEDAKRGLRRGDIPALVAVAEAEAARLLAARRRRARSSPLG